METLHSNNIISEIQKLIEGFWYDESNNGTVAKIIAAKITKEGLEALHNYSQMDADDADAVGDVITEKTCLWIRQDDRPGIILTITLIVLVALGKSTLCISSFRQSVCPPEFAGGSLSVLPSGMLFSHQVRKLLVNNKIK
jgi:hypothetical protein